MLRRGPPRRTLCGEVGCNRDLDRLRCSWGAQIAGPHIRTAADSRMFRMAPWIAVRLIGLPACATNRDTRINQFTGVPRSAWCAPPPRPRPAVRGAGGRGVRGTTAEVLSMTCSPAPCYNTENLAPLPHPNATKPPCFVCGGRLAPLGLEARGGEIRGTQATGIAGRGEYQRRTPGRGEGGAPHRATGRGSSCVPGKRRPGSDRPGIP